MRTTPVAIRQAKMCTLVLLWLAPFVSMQNVHAQSSPSAQMQKAPRDGGARRWQATQNTPVRQSRSAGAQALYTVQANQVLKNLGCQKVEGIAWCQVKPLRGGVRGYVPAEHLFAAKGPDGKIPVGVDNSRQRASKGRFDAKRSIRCAQEQGQALGECQASVARGVGGDATLVARFGNGFARSLYFVHGEFIRASATMSGVGTDTDWSVSHDHYQIRVDDQRYQVPTAFILGQ